jgi:hypothetical protein
MSRTHILITALALGLAAVLGVLALGRTLGLGAASSHANNAIVAKRSHQLDRFEAALRRQLRNMPSVPAVAPAVAPPATPALISPAAPPAVGAQRVLYVRPKPIVVTVHRTHGGDDGHEASAASDGGGEADD